MKFSHQWLSGIVDLTGITPEEVGEKLTLHTAELEEIIDGDGGDKLFDIDNKSLTHRPDLMGHEGIARELGAIFGRKKTRPQPEVSIPDAGAAIEVDIQTDTCRRFCAVRINDVNIQPSEAKLQTRLENIGVKFISNFVDTTNLVMLELGQPMHVFDADKVNGKIIVRQAKAGEKLLALDEEEYELNEHDTVVADESGVLSIAGIMGGRASGVSENTKNVVFECANWDPVAVRKTSSRLGLRSESSMRYEKSLDPENCIRGLHRAIEMAGGTASGPVTDHYPLPQTTKSIDLNFDLVRARSGLNLSDQDIVTKLEALDFKVETKGGIAQVTVPTFRATKDIAIAEDLIEEVVRLSGFDQVPSILPALPLTPPHKNKLRELDWRVRDLLSARDYLEVYNYSFVPESDNDLLEDDQAVTVANPLSEEQAQLRRTLLSNFLKNLKSELRTHKSLKLFEIGKVFEKTSDVLPREIPRLGVLNAQMGGTAQGLFYDLKNNLSRLWSGLGLEVSYQPSSEKKPYGHNTQQADIFCGATLVGCIFTVHPQKNPVKKGNIAFAEIDLEPVLNCIQALDPGYCKLSAFPEILRDIAILVPERTMVSDLTNTAREAAPELKLFELFDEFSDKEKLGEGVKNLAFHLSFQSSEKTLDEAEIEHAFQNIIQALSQKHNAQLRQ